MTTQAVTKKEKHFWVSIIYEIKWDWGAEETFREDYRKDFPLVKNLSDWLCDLSTCNIDDNGKVEREWDVIHKTPGHIFLFLNLFSDDLSRRIHYPFTEPENWESKPLPHAEWTETWVDMYDDFVIKRQELEVGSLFSMTRVRTY